MTLIVRAPRPFDDLFTGTHPVRSRAVVMVNGQPTGVAAPVVDGTVTVDESQAVRRQANLTLAALDTWVPRLPTDYLDPASRTEFCVQSGVIDDTGALTWWSLGVFGVDMPTITEDATQGIDVTVSLVDRADRVSRATVIAGRQIVVGTRVADAIATILADRAPWLPVDFPANTPTLPNTYLGTDQPDPWAQCRQLATAAALDLRVDVDGVARLHPITDPLITAPSATWVEGVDCPLLKVTRSLPGKDLINGVIVRVSNTAFTGVGQFWDTDPASPTCRAKFGDQGYTYAGDTTTITSQAAADALARSEYVIRKGRAEQVTTTVLLDPRRDAGDTITVTRARVGVDAVYRITSLRIPLTGASMDVTMGERRS